MQAPSTLISLAFTEIEPLRVLMKACKLKEVLGWRSVSISMTMPLYHKPSHTREAF